MSTQGVSATAASSVSGAIASSSASYTAGLAGQIYFGQGRGKYSDPAAMLYGREDDPDATFVAAQLNYRSGNGRLGDFLRGDSASLSTAAASQRADVYTIHLNGQIYLETGTHRFSNMSDDGFRLSIDGRVVAEFAGERAAATTTGGITIAQAGWYDINVAYFQAYGGADLQIRHQINNGANQILQVGGDSGRLRHASSEGTGEVTPPPTPANRAPVVANDSLVVNEDGSIRFNPLANDSDPDGDTLVIRSFGQGANGTVTRNSDGTLTYRPNADFNGRDSFTYLAGDGRGGTAQATVNVNVRPVNDAPVAGDDAGLSTRVGTDLRIPLTTLLANDRDVDGDALTITAVSNATGGTAMIMGDHVHFTPTAAGTASFEYRVSDGNGGTDTARVTITVHPADNTGGGTGGEDHGGHDDGDDDGETGGGDHGTGGEDHGGTGGNTGGGNSGGGHSGHGGGGTELIDPPQTRAEIDAFVRAVRAQAEAPAHANDAEMLRDHSAAMNLVARGESTHVAINHGDWNDASTWHNGEVPGDGARVLIPEGIAVNYTSVNDASLFTVRVDGHLHFATDQDSRMVVDTMVVSPSGHMTIGTEEDPVRADVNVDIVFADNGNIDVSWDPALLSRGMISHGSVIIHGEEKASHLKVEVDAMAGDTRLVLAESPEGWQVGDTLVLTGTWQQGWYWNNSTRRMELAESQDEEVTIRAINGNEIVLDRPLTYNHDTPRDDLSAYVANMTRNVTFSSEGGEDLPVHQRGHVMFMHSDDVDVRYAAFEDLGRTDKSRPSGDIDHFGGLGRLQADTNIQTRYPFHFHETGVTDLENPAMAIGNVVDGSPGWGFVHHSSNADFTNNVAFNVFGAAFVAEDGDETGIWYRNIAINSQGISYGDSSVKEERDLARNDNGRTGDGFFFAGRLVEAAENVAANTTHGYVWFHRGDRDRVDTDTIQENTIGNGRDYVGVDIPVIQGFRDNEAFGTNTGLIVIKANPDQGHDVRSVFDGFLNWETREGVNVSYTSHYTFLDFDLLAQRPEANGANAVYSGIYLGNNAFDMVVNGATIHGFQNGFDLSHNISTSGTAVQRNFQNIGIDVEITGSRGAAVLESYGGQLRQIRSEQLATDRLEFVFQGDRTISERDSIVLDGIKYDSIGAVDRNFDMEQQGIWYYDKDALLAETGYHRLPDGTPVLLFTDIIADRATGQLSRQTLVFELDYSRAALARYTDNGVVNLDGPAPITQNDRASTGMNQSVRIDLVANDRGGNGGRVVVDGLTDPTNGNVYLQDDGTVLYQPNVGYSGVDRFSYWATDGQGNFTRGEAVVSVADALGQMVSADSFDF